MSGPAAGPRADDDGGAVRIDLLTVVVAVGTIMLVSAIAAAVQTAWVLDVVGHGAAGVSTMRRLTANVVEAGVVAGALVAVGVHRHGRFVRQLWDVVVAGLAGAVARLGTQWAAGILTGQSPGTWLFQLGAGVPMAWIAGGFAVVALHAEQRVRAEAGAAARAAVARETAMHALQDEEVRVRREVAEGLHGTAQQRLVLVVAGLDHVLAELDGSVSSAVTGELRDLREKVETVRAADIRRASRLLYPHQIEVGVVAAVRALLADVPAAVGTRLTVDPAVLALDEPGDCRTTRGERLLVARVVEEAIGNALRHGHASGIAVSVGLDGDRLAIAVADDGCGLAGQPHDGSGLVRLSERLRLAGGSLHVAPGPTGGVVVSAQVPIAALARHGAPV